MNIKDFTLYPNFVFEKGNTTKENGVIDTFTIMHKIGDVEGNKRSLIKFPDIIKSIESLE